MTLYLAQASIDENGRIAGGKAGNQSGSELNVKAFYGGPGTSYAWNTVFRAKDASVRAEIARQAKAGANNKSIGYDQWERNTLLSQAKAKGWQLGNITTACECDCSSFAAVAMIAGFYNVLGTAAGDAVYNAFYYDGNLPATSTFAGKASRCSGYVQTLGYPGQSGLLLGDVIISSGHAVVVVDGTGAGSSPTPSTSGKSIDELAQEVINGKYGTGEARKAALGAMYDAVQARVNQILTGSSPAPAPAKKSNDVIADEVIRGDWGNNPARAEALKKAGYDPDAIQAIVNQKLGASSPSTPQKSIDEVAREVINGAWGNGDERRSALEKAGYDYAAVQGRVNSILKGSAASTDSGNTTPATTVAQNMRGIDVSNWNGNPFNAETERAYQEADFVIFKATQGVDKPNGIYDYALARCRADGKCMGTYHYAEGGDARAEAEYFYSRIKDAIGEVVPALDWEQTQNASWKADDGWCRRFVDRFHELSGVYPLIYCGSYELAQVASCADVCKLWVPGYPKDENSWEVPAFKYNTAPWPSYTIWQFTSGKNAVDRNTTPLTAEEWRALAKPVKQEAAAGCGCSCNQ